MKKSFSIIAGGITLALALNSCNKPADNSAQAAKDGLAVDSMVNASLKGTRMSLMADFTKTTMVIASMKADSIEKASAPEKKEEPKKKGATAKKEEPKKNTANSNTNRAGTTNNNAPASNTNRPGATNNNASGAPVSNKNRPGATNSTPPKN